MTDLANDPRAAICDHCGLPVIPDGNCYWIGADGTSECPADTDLAAPGHEVDGSIRR